MTKKRAIIIVIDSMGIGALPDCAEFGDIPDKFKEKYGLTDEDIMRMPIELYNELCILFGPFDDPVNKQRFIDVVASDWYQPRVNDMWCKEKLIRKGLFAIRNGSDKQSFTLIHNRGVRGKEGRRIDSNRHIKYKIKISYDVS